MCRCVGKQYLTLSKHRIKHKNRNRENGATRRNIEKGEEEEMARCKTKSTPGDSRGGITKAVFQGDFRNVDCIHRGHLQPEEEAKQI